MRSWARRHLASKYRGAVLGLIHAARRSAIYAAWRVASKLRLCSENTCPAASPRQRRNYGLRYRWRPNDTDAHNKFATAEHVHEEEKQLGPLESEWGGLF